MSLGLVFKGPEGIVLAADSRETLQFHPAGSQILTQGWPGPCRGNHRWVGRHRRAYPANSEQFPSRV